MSDIILQPGARILFQGDSITDAGRSREDDDVLGTGYANLVAAWLSARYPERKLVFLNKGISGNRICDLEKRWAADCVDLRPDWLSALIGVNDTWRRYDSNVLSPVPEFGDCYRRILDQAVDKCGARLIILEPFLLPISPHIVAMREDLLPRIECVRDIARDYGALYLPLDGIFAGASTRREPAFWAADGVHPTQAGHALIAQEWIRLVGV